MTRRRLFVTAIFAFAGFIAGSGRGMAAILPPDLPRAVRPIPLRSGHFLVNGWVLTARDLKELGLDAR